MFQFHEVLRFYSTVVINVLINISSLKLNNQFLKFQGMVHEYASELTTTHKAELVCSCKCRKFIGQKIGCPSYNNRFLTYLSALIIFECGNWLKCVVIS